MPAMVKKIAKMAPSKSAKTACPVSLFSGVRLASEIPSNMHESKDETPTNSANPDVKRIATMEAVASRSRRTTRRVATVRIRPTPAPMNAA